MKNQNTAVQEAARYLDEIPKFSKDKHTLETLKQMLSLLGNPQKGQKIIHIAGTNGKGSVCAFLSSIIREAGYSTAVFTSPHLLKITERFSFNGEQAGDSLFLNAFKKIREMLPAFKEAGLGHPSYFEFLFLMFLIMLKECPSDYVLLETGLGGRLDATNVIEQPLVTIITSISLDHMEYLGNTVEKIAGEKAGIIKKTIPVVFDNTDREAAAVIIEKAKEQDSPFYPVDTASFQKPALCNGKLSFSGTPLDETGQLKLLVPFPAEYQAVNSMLAVRAAELLGFSRPVICEGIKKAFWPGRMEQIQPDVYLDGAHNEGGIREFAKAAKAIAKSKKGGRRILLFAVVSDKEYKEMAEILCREFEPDVLILTQIQYSRGLDIKKLEQAAFEAWNQVDRETLGKEGLPESKKNHDVRVVETVEAAFREAVGEKRQEDTVFCAGSLYLIGEIKDMLRRNEE